MFLLLESNSASLPDWIIVFLTVASLIIAIVSLIISILAHNIAKRQEYKSFPNINSYLLSSKVFRISQDYIYAFEFTISNLASSDNSIKRIELEVEYMYGNTKCSKVFLHNNELFELINDQRHSNLPYSVEAGKSTAIKAVFKVNSDFKKENKVDVYRIKLIDTYDNSYEDVCTIINEVSYERV